YSSIVAGHVDRRLEGTRQRMGMTIRSLGDRAGSTWLTCALLGGLPLAIAGCGSTSNTSGEAPAERVEQAASALGRSCTPAGTNVVVRTDGDCDLPRGVTPCHPCPSRYRPSRGWRSVFSSPRHARDAGATRASRPALPAPAEAPPAGAAVGPAGAAVAPG